MLEVTNLEKSFNSVPVVDGVSFKVPPGEIFALLGPNGAGKTTTLRMVMNIIKPDLGEILYKGESRSKSKLAEFGYLPEERGLYQRAIVLDLIVYIGMLNRLSRHRAEVEAIRYLDKLGLIQYTKHRVSDLSKGMQQKLQFIIATLHNPEVLILDEPFIGLDPVNQIVLREMIQQYKTEGKIIILSTHQMAEAEKLSDHLCLINQGKKIIDGSISEIKERYRENAYYIEVDRDISFIHNYKSIDILEEHNQSCKIALRNETDDVNKLLQLIGAKATIKKFMQVEATLHDIFIKLVQEEQTSKKKKSR